ncbi:hypothetical protein H4Q26_002042 [Puccinia striiformis f. sp. tritici PST-130]|nr:hypothetical protein H4Q26_002042 [Puccinia striiformis f. sp. tritici PST-130]
MRISICSLFIASCLVSLEVGAAATTSFVPQSRTLQQKRHVGAAAIAQDSHIETQVGTFDTSKTRDLVLPTKTSESEVENSESPTSMSNGSPTPSNRRARRDLFGKGKAKTAAKVGARATAPLRDSPPTLQTRQFNPYPPPSFFPMRNDMGFQPFLAQDQMLPDFYMGEESSPMQMMDFEEDLSLPPFFPQEAFPIREFSRPYSGRVFVPRSMAPLELVESVFPLLAGENGPTTSDSSAESDEPELPLVIAVETEGEAVSPASTPSIMLLPTGEDADSAAAFAADESTTTTFVLVEDDNASGDQAIVLVKVEEDTPSLALTDDDRLPTEHFSNAEDEDESAGSEIVIIEAVEEDSHCSALSGEDATDDEAASEATIIIVVPDEEEADEEEDLTLIPHHGDDVASLDLSPTNDTISEARAIGLGLVEESPSFPPMIVENDRPAMRGSTSLVSVDKRAMGFPVEIK